MTPTRIRQTAPPQDHDAEIKRLLLKMIELADGLNHEVTDLRDRLAEAEARANRVTITDAISIGFKNYFRSKGRASRAEFWWFAAVMVFVGFILQYLAISLKPMAVIAMGGVNVAEYASILFTLGTLIPWFTFCIRRLHDSGKSGWWILLGMIPLLGTGTIIVFLCKKGDPEENAYGSPPDSLC